MFNWDGTLPIHPENLVDLGAGVFGDVATVNGKVAQPER